jgi:catechol 2,3-dioxygenase-like lactoylglutathione lyase family enzyme
VHALHKGQNAVHDEQHQWCEVFLHAEAKFKEGDRMINTISYVMYRHRDLGPIRTFYQDFGLTVAHETPDRIYFRGCNDAPFLYIAERGEEPGFVGAAFEVDSEESLKNLSRRLNAPIEAVDHPGGGKRVTTADPDGKRIELIYGASRAEPAGSIREPVAWNCAGSQKRRGRFPIFEVGPAPVLRVAHVVMSSPQPQRVIDWFVEVLGAYPSDIIIGANDQPMGAFMRFPRGEQFVDHHNIAVFHGPTSGAQHTCFETIDLDAIGIGRRYLISKGYRASWGLVRHALGGAMSDYWHDPSGFRVEHVTDGDQLNDTFPTAFTPATQDSLEQWSTNPMPEDFFLSEPSALRAVG